MGKHVPLPTDPLERLLEKRRRATQHMRNHRARERAKRNAKIMAKLKAERERKAELAHIRERHKLGYDLIGEL